MWSKAKKTFRLFSGFNLQKKIIVTGANGFIGSRLTSYLRGHNYKVSAPSFQLEDYSSYANLLSSEEWDAVVHLAGVSSYSACEENPKQAYQTNLGATAMLSELVAKYTPAAQMIFASTSQVYAPSRDAEVLLTEESLVKPQTVYAKTKYLAEVAIEATTKVSPLKAAVFRIFNHSHKSQSRDFFLPHVFHELTSAMGQQQILIKTGNIDLYRDIGDVDDLVRAFEKIIDRSADADSRFEIYNVCNGKPRLLRDLANELSVALNKKVAFEVDTARMRAGEPLSIVGSNVKIQNALNWKPAELTNRDLIKRFLA
ncbi:MAG: NAD-dependent epimerase/dehydratase family protein [Proteobacteria bacterium]|nr:MAG: NAD-dependent epimerase/dehydratase family protein [Pseudomonadota bacterium]